jgi:hypothetical protein
MKDNIFKINNTLKLSTFGIISPFSNLNRFKSSFSSSFLTTFDLSKFQAMHSLFGIPGEKKNEKY